MSKWHCICEDELIFKNDPFKSGKYYCYHIDVFDRLLNDNNWVHANDAFEEQCWIFDQLDKMVESNDGDFVFIPTFSVAEKILEQRIWLQVKAQEDFTKEMDWPV